ncbi:MAG: hypothetical protein AAF378_06910 [Cyanobacteria bacterium P01_A01_bin.84]
MFKFQRPQWLKYLGMDFWLPLPILGLCFWLATNLVTNHIITYSAKSMVQPQLVKPKAPYKDISIQVKIYQGMGFCEVYVKKKTEEIERSQFKLPTTDLSTIQATISQRLNIPLEELNERMLYLHKQNK